MYKNVLDDHPTSVEALINLTIHESSKNRPLAFRYLKIAKKFEPDNKTININIGNLCLLEKKYS